MDYKKLYAALSERRKEYEKSHAQTVDTDLKIMMALSIGNSIRKIFIDIPCDISTVYRSIARAESFLQNDEEIEDILDSSLIVSHAITRGRKSYRSALGIDLYTFLIIQHQKGYNSISGSIIKRYLPGLRNKKQRDAVMNELNNLTILTDEEEAKTIKIFEYVEYSNRNYNFELTEEAYPYYYPLYALLEKHPQFQNLFDQQ